MIFQKALLERRQMKKPRLIAVVGGSGSGKTWLAGKLGEWLGDEAGHLCLDSFYRDLGHLPPDERCLANFDDPDAIDWEALRGVLETLENGQTAQVPVYDFAEHIQRKETVELPWRPIMVLEGLWLLHPEWLREKLAYSIFVDCPEDERLLRRIERDVLTRGRTEESVRRQFSEHVQPMHALFVEPQRQHAMRCVSSPQTEMEHAELIAACRG